MQHNTGHSNHSGSSRNHSYSSLGPSARCLVKPLDKPSTTVSANGQIAQRSSVNRLAGRNANVNAPNPQQAKKAAEPRPQAAEPRPQAAEPRPQAAEPRPQAAEPRPQAAEPRPQGKDLRQAPSSKNLAPVFYTKAGAKSAAQQPNKSILPSPRPTDIRKVASKKTESINATEQALGPPCSAILYIDGNGVRLYSPHIGVTKVIKVARKGPHLDLHSLRKAIIGCIEQFFADVPLRLQSTSFFVYFDCQGIEYVVRDFEKFEDVYDFCLNHKICRAGSSKKGVFSRNTHGFSNGMFEVGFTLFDTTYAECIAHALEEMAVEICSIASPWQGIANVNQCPFPVLYIDITNSFASSALITNCNIIKGLASSARFSLSCMVREVASYFSISPDQAFRFIRGYAMLTSEADRMNAMNNRKPGADEDLALLLTSDCMNALDKLCLNFLGRCVHGFLAVYREKGLSAPQHICFVEGPCFNSSKAKMREIQNLDAIINFFQYEDSFQHIWNSLPVPVEDQIEPDSDLHGSSTNHHPDIASSIKDFALRIKSCMREVFFFNAS